MSGIIIIVSLEVRAILFGVRTALEKAAQMKTGTTPDGAVK